MQVENQEFYSIVQLSLKLNIHPNTLRRHIKSGKILALKMGTPKKWIYRIPSNEIQNLILRHPENYIEKLIEDKIRSHERRSDT